MDPPVALTATAPRTAMTSKAPEAHAGHHRGTLPRLAETTGRGALEVSPRRAPTGPAGIRGPAITPRGAETSHRRGRRVSLSPEAVVPRRLKR